MYSRDSRCRHCQEDTKQPCAACIVVVFLLANLYTVFSVHHRACTTLETFPACDGSPDPTPWKGAPDGSEAMVSAAGRNACAALGPTTSDTAALKLRRSLADTQHPRSFVRGTRELELTSQCVLSRPISAFSNT